ncbi:hypothetical protein [Staphylococcus carnosus]|uniref:Phage protein n=1 Tax=Staphylococcus carnosus TaxID=1281 RepID=A0AAJ0NG59_STACA|nr:hypothetical protein [Staphylococcus carnosus]KKB24270.1 hypothetical protein VV61_12740 [Staphylococcus carnosus]POA08059.1 hypothetical protein CD153_00540 [Staphylococcus carnosus]QQS86509.1 hypothetical protein I6J04_13005 [Staphylococcus carnosus]QRQ04005.1 hypothetical protein I6J34_00015 [Staphylococcus carnosus]UTB84161.1 hypothetical protein A2I67_12860 [Staphylococcus carnosus]
MIFIYIIFSAILLYYALKYGIRNGFVDLEEIGNIYSRVSTSKSKEAKAIYNEAFDILLSEKKPKIIFKELTEKKEEIFKLSIDD